MGRTYSDPSYGARQIITLSGNIAETTAAGLATQLAHTCLYPCKIVDVNINFPLGFAGDMGTATSATLAKSTDAGTGVTAFCTCDFYSELATCTFAAGEVVNYAPVETTFSAGDQICFQMEGTVGAICSQIEINLEVQEVFENADS
jgi:hypothetical protein